MPRQSQKQKGKGKKSDDKAQHVEEKPKHVEVTDSMIENIRQLVKSGQYGSVLRGISSLESSESATIPLVLRCYKAYVLAKSDETKATEYVLEEVTQSESLLSQCDSECLEYLHQSCVLTGFVQIWERILEKCLLSKDAKMAITEPCARDMFVVYFANDKYDKLAAWSARMKQSFPQNSDVYMLWYLLSMELQVVASTVHLWFPVYWSQRDEMKDILGTFQTDEKEKEKKNIIFPLVTTKSYNLLNKCVNASCSIPKPNNRSRWIGPLVAI
ncbi:hypothetical protein RFI_28797 [Reticulomyxa filosa]|uniref:Uncharacterized protein n=1 Tax=Reticulomyxa filosa TaxID=46433 RepID=X6M3N7_RETFI|nr:hypothetical protein RFI_28797 [Reticulomyxa filosa]|eukprot:ETO08588.1 hypothetical protein RFI_28797 [Reticulomyxa filosa]